MAQPIVTRLNTGVGFMQAYDLDFGGGSKTDPCPIVHSLGTDQLIITTTIFSSAGSATLNVELTDANTVTVVVGGDAVPSGARIVLQRFPIAT